MCIFKSQYIIEGSFPGERVGPEPTTEKFVAIMGHKEERLIPGNAAGILLQFQNNLFVTINIVCNFTAISSEFPFSGLQKVMQN